MKVNVQKFTEEFGLRPFGAKGWKNSKSLNCPHCGKDYSKFGILFLENGTGVYKCFRCDSKGSIFTLLKKIGRTDLIIGSKDDFVFRDKLESLLRFTKKQEVDLELGTIRLPIGFNRIFYHPYLEERGWVKGDYEKYEVGVSFMPRFQDRLIFLIREDHKLVAYLSRSLKSKQWHDENLKSSKQGLCKLCLRYDNSHSPFEKIVGGFDDIYEGVTKTVIMVEGLMDKVNVDRELRLDEDNEIKCVFNFGCHLSISQLYKIYKKGVENIILMFDSETIKQTKSVSLELSNFFNIFISEIEGDLDPGEMDLHDFNRALSSLKNPIDYFTNKLEKIVLR